MFSEYWNRDDSKKHFIVGVAIWACTMLVAPQYAIFTPAVVGVAKELVWDSLLGRGTPDVSDAVLTALPGLLSLVI